MRTKEGWNALIIAAYHNRLDLVRHLVEEGWDINDKNYRGTTVLMYSMTAASKDSNLDTLKYLASKANWAQMDNHRKDIFHYAQVYGNPQVIEFIRSYKKG